MQRESNLRNYGGKSIWCVAALRVKAFPSGGFVTGRMPETNSPAVMLNL